MKQEDARFACLGLCRGILHQTYALHVVSLSIAFSLFYHVTLICTTAEGVAPHPDFFNSAASSHSRRARI